MSKELNQIAGRLAEARVMKKNAEKTIAELAPQYFKLLDKEVGKGQVEFQYDGWRYGRIVAEKSSFDTALFMVDHPEIAEHVLLAKTTYLLDEPALQDYLAEHPELQPVVEKYVEIKPEARWKNPVPVKDEE